MKLKKYLLVSSSAFLLGIFSPAISEFIMNENQVTVTAQEDQTTLLQRIKTSLLEQEPIVEKQLAEVSDENLLAYYDAASNDLTWSDIYKAIANNYPQLGLMANEAEITKFKNILKEVVAVTGKSLYDLRNVDPKTLISSYDQAKVANPNDSGAAIKSFIDTIDLDFGKVTEVVTEAETEVVTEAETEAITEAETEAITEAEIDSETTTEAEAATDIEIAGLTVEETNEEMIEESISETLESETTSSDSTVQTEDNAVVTTNIEENSITSIDNSTAFREALLKATDITNEQLESITSDEMQKVLEITGLNESAIADEYLQIIRRELVTQFPERFTTDQIYSVATQLRLFAVSYSPMTDEIANQIPDEDFLQWSREANALGNDISYPYWQAYKNNSSLFENLLVEAKDGIIKNTNLTQAQLDQMDGAVIVYSYWDAKANELPFESLEASLKQQFPDAVAEPITTTIPSTTLPETTTNINEQTTVANTKSPETTSQVNTTNATTTVAVVTKTSVESKNKLPVTGETSSVWIFIGAALAAIGGFFILRGKKDKKE